MTRSCRSYIWIILPCVSIQGLMLWLLVKDIFIQKEVIQPTAQASFQLIENVEPDVISPLDVLAPHARIIPDSSQEATLVIQDDILKFMKNRCYTNESAILCPCLPPALKPRMRIDVKQAASYTWDNVTRILSPLSTLRGGAHRPVECVARQRVLIVVPYRDREHHLKGLLAHLHPILQAQQLDYRILVVEQREPAIFNKAACMNSAFLEASARWAFDCVVFHDVDTLMEDGRSLITCGDRPVHYSICLDREKYRRSMKMWFGGVVSMTTEQFRTVNGFSNRFFGWGAEDINMSFRMQKKKMLKVTPHALLGRYSTMKHGRDNTNPKNCWNRKMIQVVTVEGLSTARYSMVKFEEFRFYSYMLLDLNMTRMKYPSLGRLMHLYKKTNGDCPTKPSLQEISVTDKRACVLACDVLSACTAAIFINITTSTDNLRKCVLKDKVCRSEVRKRKHWIFSKNDYIPCRMYRMNDTQTPVIEDSVTISSYDPMD